MNIILYSTTGCTYCAKIKADLNRWELPYEERNVAEDQTYFNDLHARGIFSTPVTFIDGEAVIGYRPNKMKQILGITPEQDQGTVAPATPASTNEVTPAADQPLFTELTPAMFAEVYDLVIVGSGPAGASAAVYAARGKLKTLVLDKAPAGGALAITHKIANYPGVTEEVTGLELVDRIRKQARDYGAVFAKGNVQSLELQGEIKQIFLPDGIVQSRSVFLAVGARGRTSKLKGEEEFAGRGVSYCTTCDAAFFAGRTVAVIGDTAEAVSEAHTLSQFAKQVHFLIPGKKLTGTATLDDLDGQTNIDVRFSHRVLEIVGNEAGRLEGVLVKNETGETTTLPVDGVFLYVSGNKPATDFIGNSVARDEEGYLIVNELLQTNVAGVFAGGDARRTPLKQAVIAAADGAIAAQGADKHVNKRKRMIAQYS